ncbi:hypothetical protein HYT33_01470 [Candidatus Roizmanbacteria bacterium]|nr:hypothetical protein [Candidatus Roizmanbacteria bacterium]
MGKVRTRFLGVEEVEQKQKAKQKKKAKEKQVKKVRAPGQKGGERMRVIEADEATLQKMKRAEELAKAKPEEVIAQKKKQKVKARKRGKNYQMAKREIEKGKLYPLSEGIVLVKKIRFGNFDESVELHLNLTKAGLRGEAAFPYSSGKKMKVAVVDDKVLSDIENGKIDFDVLIAEPSYMPRLAKFAKILGPKGLMPSPKSGTVTDKPKEAMKKFEGGVFHWRAEAKSPLLHVSVGKSSQDEKELLENAKRLILSVGKGNIRGVFLKTTMSPAVKIDVESI